VARKPDQPALVRRVGGGYRHAGSAVSTTSRIPPELIPKVNLNEARRIAGCAIA